MWIAVGTSGSDVSIDGGNAIVEPAFAPEGQATTTAPLDASTGAVS